MTRPTDAEVREMCAEFFADLQIEHGDAEISEDGLRASIPYYSHGRWRAHVIDLQQMARTAFDVFSRAALTAQETTDD